MPTKPSMLQSGRHARQDCGRRFRRHPTQETGREFRRHRLEQCGGILWLHGLVDSGQLLDIVLGSAVCDGEGGFQRLLHRQKFFHALGDRRIRQRQCRQAIPQGGLLLGNSVLSQGQGFCQGTWHFAGGRFRCDGSSRFLLRRACQSRTYA
jgi:hypothetical protein